MNEFMIKDGELTKAKIYNGDVVIPDNVTKIVHHPYDMKGAFQDCVNLTSVKIPNSVTEIGHDAFNGCTNLTNIEIPDSVLGIGGYAFAYCTNLTEITIPDSVWRLGNGVFSHCTNLTNITIPKSVTSITPYMFSDCTKLTNIEMPDRITKIEMFAFKNCTSLTSLTIPENVTNIEDTAFEGCTNLKEINWNSSIIPTKEMLEKLFKDCPNLESINYHGKPIIMNSEINGLIIKNGTLVDGKNASGDVVIPDGVISIGNEAFSNCTGLTSITLPEGVKFIGSKAFYGCTNLTNIEIPKSVTLIGGRAFAYCDSLTDMTIPDSVTSIGEYVFNNCENLLSINVPLHTEFEDGYWESTYNYETEPRIFCSNCPNLREVRWDSHQRPTVELVNSIIEDCPNIEKLIYNGKEIDMRKHEKLESIIDNYKSLPIEEKELNLDDLIKSLSEAR